PCPYSAPVSTLPCYRRSLFFSCRPPPTQLSTLSLHDALPIYAFARHEIDVFTIMLTQNTNHLACLILNEFHSLSIGEYFHFIRIDRKSTRLNSSHVSISYAVFCLKKK